MDQQLSCARLCEDAFVGASSSRLRSGRRRQPAFRAVSVGFAFFVLVIARQRRDCGAVFAIPSAGWWECNLGSGRLTGHEERWHQRRQTASPRTKCTACAPQVWLGCALPSLLGFWKSEYGVSYGYGGAMAISGAVLLREAMSVGAPTLVLLHAAVLLLYGVRATSFFLYRELTIPRFRKFREKIEDRALRRGSRLSRFPFLAFCAALYAGMAAPALLTLQAARTGALSGPTPTLAACIVVMYASWALAAAADTYKSWRKAVRGEDAIVTGGPFYFLRHPNYTGEQFLWTASALAGVLAMRLMGKSGLTGLTTSSLGGTILGALGINFVLANATAALEQRQLEKYGDKTEYKSWLSRSWAGFRLSKGGKATASASAPEGEVEPRATQ